MADEPAKIILGDTIISAVEEPGRKRFFRRKGQRPPLTHCENCGTQLSGMYCPQCGQAAIDYRRSFRHVIVDLLDSFLNWDSKFFHTIALLLTRPWRLTIEFLAGHRVKYLHPARLYLLTSIAFFFAATSWIKSLEIDPINLSPAQREEIRSELERENVAPEVRAKIEAALGGPAISTEKRSELKAQLKRDDLPEEERSKIEKQLEDDVPPDARTKMEEAMKNLPAETRAKVDQALKQPLEDKSKLIETEDKTPPDSFDKWIEGRARQKFGEAGTNIQLFLVTLISNLPYMMLACVPLFAFVLKILYLRKRIFYIDHLVYAFHIHTFAYLAIMLIVLATMGLNRTAPAALAGWTIALLWTTFAVQIFLSIRRVYRQGWFFSILKFFVGGVAYLVVLFAALATTFLITLALP
jgi:uncharacterized membrane protein